VGKYGWAEENGLKCNMTCNGNSNEICGGVMANSVYYTSLMQTSTTATTATTTESTIAQSLITLNANTIALTSKKIIFFLGGGGGGLFGIFWSMILSDCSYRFLVTVGWTISVVENERFTVKNKALKMHYFWLK
jgi:hypothetical protein